MGNRRAIEEGGFSVTATKPASTGRQLAPPAGFRYGRSVATDRKDPAMDEFRISLGAELSKINFLLENLYALTLHRLGASHDEIPDLADEMARQFDLPGSVHGSGEDAAELAAIHDLASHRLTMFLSGVRDRLRQIEED